MALSLPCMHYGPELTGAVAASLSNLVPLSLRLDLTWLLGYYYYWRWLLFENKVVASSLACCVLRAPIYDT